MKWTRIGARDFDLAKTLDSGQVFHWTAHDKGFVGVIGDAPAYVEQCGTELIADGVPAARLAHYFALDHPLGEICASFPADPTMSNAAAFCRGLRILRQPKWECLAMFICSSMKQVAHIRQMSQAIRSRFGTKSQINGVDLFSFPSVNRVAALTEEQLRACGLGYRAKNLLGTARMLSERNNDLESWTKLADDELRATLCGLPGVGPKVANCVMLFAYERLRAFPIDVWIERVLRNSYFRRRKSTPAILREFSATYFGPHGGYAQQYLFHFARKMKKGRSSSAG